MNKRLNKDGIHAAQDVFEQQLAQQIRLSEKKRITLVAIILSFLTLHFFMMACCFTGTLPKEFELDLYGLPFWIGFNILLAAFAAYEWMLLVFFNDVIKKDKQLSVFLRYFNAFAETSLPTIAIILLAQVIDPIFALVSPPSFIYFIFIILAVLRLDLKLCLFTGTIAALEYISLAGFYISTMDESAKTVLALMPHHVIKTLILFVTGLITGLVTLELKRQMTHSFRSIEERNNIANIFGQHVSPAVVDKLLHQHPTEMNTEMRHVCVMFLDIRDFTTFSENNPPEKVVNFLNTLFEPMIDIINQHNGVINKFLGDGFMAIFGAPISDGKDSQNAVNAAQEIIETVKQKIAKAEIPPIRIGIGLHTGKVVTGNVGSAQRKEYTVIGDVVNLASRIEQLNKQFDSQLLISAAVWEAIGQNIDTIIDQGLIPVKGRKEPVQIYRIH